MEWPGEQQWGTSQGLAPPPPLLQACRPAGLPLLGATFLCLLRLLTPRSSGGGGLLPKLRLCLAGTPRACLAPQHQSNVPAILVARMEALGREREPAELRALLWLLWQAMLLAKDIRDRERGGRAEIGVIEGDKEAASPGLMTVLQDTLGRRSMIKPAVSDEIMDQQQKSSIMLYQ